MRLGVEPAEYLFNVGQYLEHFIVSSLPCEVDAHNVLTFGRAEWNVIRAYHSRFGNLNEMFENMSDLIE